MQFLPAIFCSGYIPPAGRTWTTFRSWWPLFFFLFFLWKCAWMVFFSHSLRFPFLFSLLAVGLFPRFFTDLDAVRIAGSVSFLLPLFLFHPLLRTWAIMGSDVPAPLSIPGYPFWIQLRSGVPAPLSIPGYPYYSSCNSKFLFSFLFI